ncbi:TetR/AcrR family transcriptional regulator [Tardiphaga sp. 42S5]|uniref:TetR/AcrR family transcriptional regulator n=1 Tax=Tardiphaga sp. 42S5 TaxID=1404799 RepID=UPI002A5A7395|nr:TetR/AcrR family transcriptional regulator [Tardiphaga sp. 42S5]WPO43963.1 TetR/AcrR family transcriptional regulator [Tardiphaga sp. 42S5]
MRYSKEHKSAVHTRIVKAASALFREKGSRGAGVVDVMKAIGLTHGGFYQHFKSKDVLFIEALTHAMDQSVARWRKAARGPTPTHRLKGVVDAYLTPRHRDNLADGCAVATMGAEIARESGAIHEAYAAKLEEMIGVLSERRPEGENAGVRKHALVALSAMVGALVLARATGKGALSQEILVATREGLSAQAEDLRSGRYGVGTQSFRRT